MRLHYKCGRCGTIWQDSHDENTRCECSHCLDGNSITPQWCIETLMKLGRVMIIGNEMIIK